MSSDEFSGKTVVPIFPLNTVLFPGGLLPLRIFEARYVDMVRSCLREDQADSEDERRSGDDRDDHRGGDRGNNRRREFGVCLIRKGREVGTGPDQAEPEDVGCRARIVDWSMEQLGVLHIVVLGTERFRIRQTSCAPNGLLTACVDPLEAEDEAPIPAPFAPCASLLADILSRLDEESVGRGGTDERITPGTSPAIAKPHRLSDASWVGNRLSEMLPVPLSAKQQLMELTDAASRLAIVYQYLHQQKII